MNDVVERSVGSLLKQKKWMLALAESCTGGLAGHKITNIPGSSDYFLGGIIAYANATKEQLLGVDKATLERHGAVSRETAVEMVRGIRLAIGAEVGLAITGIAGPGGGEPDKPVGLTWIAALTPEQELVEKYIWQGSRLENKEWSAEAALALLLAVLENTE